MNKTRYSLHSLLIKKVSLPLQSDIKHMFMKTSVAKMNVNKQQHQREFRKFMELNPKFRNSDVVCHFLKQGMSRATIYRTIKRIRDGVQDKTRHGGGRKTKELTTKVKEELKKMFNGKIGVSINHAARNLKVGWHTIENC